MKGISPPPPLPIIAITPPSPDPSDIHTGRKINKPEEKAAVASVQGLMKPASAQIKDIKDSLKIKQAREWEFKEPSLKTTGMGGMARFSAVIPESMLTTTREELAKHQCNLEMLQSSETTSSLTAEIQVCLALIYQLLQWLTKVNTSEEDNLDFCFTVRQAGFSLISIYGQCPQLISAPSSREAPVQIPIQLTNEQLLSRLQQIGITGAAGQSDTLIPSEKLEESTTTKKPKKKHKKHKHTQPDTLVEKELLNITQQKSPKEITTEEVQEKLKQLIDAIKLNNQTLNNKLEFGAKNQRTLLGVKAGLKFNIDTIQDIMSILTKVVKELPDLAIFADSALQLIRNVLTEEKTDLDKMKTEMRQYSLSQLQKFIAITEMILQPILGFHRTCTEKLIEETKQILSKIQETKAQVTNFFKLATPSVPTVMSSETSNILSSRFLWDLREILFSARKIIVDLGKETIDESMPLLERLLVKMLEYLSRLTEKGINKNIKSHASALLRSFDQAFGSPEKLSEIITTHASDIREFSVIMSMLCELLDLVFEFHEVLKITQETYLSSIKPVRF